MKVVQLRTIAKWVNENIADLGFSATAEKSWSNTDRKHRGSRMRWPGKGRDGIKLSVYRRLRLCFSHDSSECYRYNDEALRALESTLGVLKQQKRMPAEWRGR